MGSFRAQTVIRVLGDGAPYHGAFTLIVPRGGLFFKHCAIELELQLSMGRRPPSKRERRSRQGPAGTPRPTTIPKQSSRRSRVVQRRVEQRAGTRPHCTGRGATSELSGGGEAMETVGDARDWKEPIAVRTGGAPPSAGAACSAHFVTLREPATSPRLPQLA